MMRKNKNTDLAAKPAKGATDGRLAPRVSWDWFREMDRWFDDLRTEFERNFGGPLTPLGREAGLTVRRPLVDLLDHGAEYVLTAELPGVRKEDLDIRVTPEGVELAGQASRDKEKNGRDYTYRERAYVSFRRSLSLPEEVVADRAEAKLKDGVLEVRLPKKEPSPARQPVQVRVE